MQWGCNAPIMELLLGKITAEASSCAQKLEIWVSSDLEASYHNLHKVDHFAIYFKIIRNYACHLITHF